MRNEICRYLANRPIPLTPRRLATSQINGEWPSPYTGKGMDFKSHRAFQLGDDLRSINMAMSIRAGKRMIVERIAMRDISIYMLLDCRPSMSVRSKAQIMKAVALMILYSGSIKEMRVGAAILKNDGYCNLGLGMGNRHTLRMMDSIEEICDSLEINRPMDIEFSTQSLHKLLPSGCILFYVSDCLDSEGNPNPKFPFMVNTMKYDLIPIVIQDEFEYTFPDLPGDSMLELVDPESDDAYPVWFDDNETIKLRQLNESRFSKINDGFHDLGLSYIHVSMSEIDTIHQSLSNYFLYR